MSFVKIDPKDCSPLGKFILEYMEETGTSMQQLADRAGLTRPGLRGMCFIRGNPTESSLIRLARAMGVPPAEIYKLAYQNRFENPYNPDAIDLFIEGVDTILKAMRKVVEKQPEHCRPSDNELLEKAIRTVKSLQG
jgi:transcriptional regulator with XRE-family HTH domain